MSAGARIEAKGKADRITELYTEKKKVESEFEKTEKNIENFGDELKEKNREYENKKPVLLELEELRESDKKMAEKEGELKGEIS